MRHAKRWQMALAAAAWMWVAAVLFFPAAVFPIGAFVCHQRPDRSFFFHGHQVAVCARCTGLYMGAAAAAVPAAFVAYSLSAAVNRRLLALAAAPTLVTWTLEFIGVMPFSNVVRFLAALPLGAAAAWLVLSEFVYRSSTVGHRTSPAAP